ncbi:MAG: extracellular solute-binding protein [Lachnospiraceae bacterium]|nr:extracellular solute-binding protein [Lachnospiraceae bacterium]
MKSKIAKKVIAASLATVMTVGLAACGNEPAQTGGSDTAEPGSVEQSTPDASTPEESTPEESSSEEEEVSPYTVLTDENGNVYDLGGMEIILRDWWTGDPSDPTNDYEEARDEYREWIQETYNFTFKQQAISDWGSAPEDFVNYASTGGEENYIFIVREAAATTAAMNSGLMYDLSTLDCLDFSEAKWLGEGGVHKLMSKGDSIYCMYAGDTEPRTGVYFNKRLLEEAGIDPNKPYELQEAGEWTWDAFVDLCAQVQRDTDNDGVIDVYAMTQNDSVVANNAVYSNGGNYVGKDSSGYTYELESDATVEALNWAVDTMTQYKLPYPQDANWDYYVQAFLNGEAVFCAEDAYKAGGDFSTMEDDFGFVCFPKGPKANDYTNIFSNNPVCIPACYDAEKAWNLAFAYNLWTDPIPGYEDYEAWRATYNANFRDSESVDYTIARMMKNGRVTFHGLIANLDLGNDLTYSLLDGTSVSEHIEKIRDTWQAYIDETNAN